MKTQALPGSLTARRFAVCPTTVLAGDPVLIGKMPAVALDNYQSNEGGTTFEMSGSYLLSVLASTAISPISGVAISFGDKIYASGGTLGAGNVTTGITLTGRTSDPLFGYYDPQENAAAITSGTTNSSAAVKLSGSE